jgi:hypothetical protein
LSNHNMPVFIDSSITNSFLLMQDSFQLETLIFAN